MPDPTQQAALPGRTQRACLDAAFSVCVLALSACESYTPPPKLPEITAIDLSVECYTLANGLRVVLHEDHAAPLVAVNVAYRVGSSDDPRGRAGLAHLLEHMMFQGSRHARAADFLYGPKRAGAQDANGVTEPDWTVYYETVPSNQLAFALWLESDRMGFLLDGLDAESFANEREIVRNEMRHKVDDAAFGNVGGFIAAELYEPNHPYSRARRPTGRYVDAISLDHLRAFYRTYYVPNNATLVLAGDFSRADAKRLVDRYFGPLPKSATPMRMLAGPARPTKQKWLHVEAGVNTARLVVRWPAPAAFSDGEVELALADRWIAARLRESLEEQGIARDVDTDYFRGVHAGDYTIEATLTPGTKPEAALEAIDDALAEVVDQFGWFAVSAQRRSVLAELVFSIEGMTSRAERLSYYDTFAHDARFLNRDIARIGAVAPIDVERVLTDTLLDERRVVAAVHPTANAPLAGRLAREP